MIKTDWDLKQIYKTEEDAIKDFETIKQLKSELVNFNGKLNSKENLKNFFDKQTSCLKIEVRLTSYLFLRKSLNGKDEFSRKIEAELNIFSTQIGPKLGFISEQLANNSDEFLLSLKKDPDFKDYDIALQDIIDGKKHILSEEVQSAMNMNPSFGSSSEVFDAFNDIDLKFGTMKVDGKTLKLTHATYSKLIQHPNQIVRKTAYDKVHKAYAGFNYTLGTLYLSGARETLFDSKLHKFSSVLNDSCFSDKTSELVLPTLINSVHKNMQHFYRYQDLKKKALKLDKYYYFDNYVPLGKCRSKFDFNKCSNIVLDALSVMGKEYVGVLKKALEEGWIDAFEKPAKTSGGFCLSIYGFHPYVLLNHEDNYNGLSTLAHELGHAMHGYYTDKTQPITKADPSIFACEVASIVNEIILSLYMIDRAENKQEKMFYLDQLLFHFYSTLYRQTMFSEFEHYVYTTLERQEPLIVENLNSKYEQLQKLYFGDALKTLYSKYEWSRIPHFYRPYYVYKYSTGFISACTIARKIMAGEKGYLQKYVAFLKAGDSVDPISLLKSVDVDLTKEETLMGAFELYKSLLNELEKLV